MKSLWHQRSYEGSMKSVPDDDLLKMLAADLDPAHVKQLGRNLFWDQTSIEAEYDQSCICTFIFFICNRLIIQW